MTTKTKPKPKTKTRMKAKPMTTEPTMVQLPEVPDGELTTAEIEQAGSDPESFADGIYDDDVREETNENAGVGEDYYVAKDPAGGMLLRMQPTSSLKTNGFVTVYAAPYGTPRAVPLEHVRNYLVKPIDPMRFPQFVPQQRKAFYGRPQRWSIEPPTLEFSCAWCQKQLISEESRMGHERGAHGSQYRLRETQEARQDREAARQQAAAMTVVMQLLAESDATQKANIENLMRDRGVKLEGV